MIQGRQMALVLAVGVIFRIGCASRGTETLGEDVRGVGGTQMPCYEEPQKPYTKDIDAKVKVAFDNIGDLTGASFEASLHREVVRLAQYSTIGLDIDLVLLRICEMSVNRGFSEDQTEKLISAARKEWVGAEYALTRVGELAGSDEERLATSLGSLGLVYFWQGSIEKAEQRHPRWFAIGEELSCKQGMAGQHCNLGNVYFRQGDHAKPEQQYRRVLELEGELGFTSIANTLAALGVIYAEQGDLEQAERYFLRSLAIDEDLGNKEGMAEVLGNLGLIYSAQGDLEMAEDHLQRALELLKSVGAKSMIEEVRGLLDDVRATPAT